MKTRIHFSTPSSEKKIIFVIVGAELEAFMNDALWNPLTPLLAQNNSTITCPITLDVRFILRNLKFRCATRWVASNPKIETLPEPSVCKQKSHTWYTILGCRCRSPPRLLSVITDLGVWLILFTDLWCRCQIVAQLLSSGCNEQLPTPPFPHLYLSYSCRASLQERNMRREYCIFFSIMVNNKTKDYWFAQCSCIV